MSVETNPRGEFGALLGRLHDLIAQGRGGSDEADALREEMGGPWRAMTEAERDESLRLSERLYGEYGEGAA